MDALPLFISLFAIVLALLFFPFRRTPKRVEPPQVIRFVPRSTLATEFRAEVQAAGQVIQFPQPTQSAEKGNQQ